MASEIEWRRTRKPDLKMKPWLTFPKKRYLLKYIFRDSSYEIMVTNCIHTWYENLDHSFIRSRTKEFNPNLEAPVSTILKHIEDVLESKESLDISEKDESLIVKIECQLAGIPFIWQFFCSLAISEMMSEHLTIPLLIMVTELQRRQKELVQLLKKKDAELQDYKSQGATVSRRYLETPLFNEKAFHHEMAMSKGFKEAVENDYSIDGVGHLLYTDVMMKAAWLNSEMLTDQAATVSFPVDDINILNTKTQGTSWSDDRLPGSLLNYPESPEKRQKRTLDTPNSPSSQDIELLRRQDLERKLEEEKVKKLVKKKKKKALF